MSPIGQPERATQNRVIALFRDELGYRTLGGWIDRAPSTKAKFAVARHQPHTEMNNRNRDHSSLRRPASVAVPTPAQGGARH
jgi:type I restriction enzyme R subunit